MKKMMIALSIIGLTAALMSGCSSTKCTWFGATSIYGEWEVENTPKDVDADMTITADGKVSGCSGVNRYFGACTVDPATQTIKFGAMGLTMMAGPQVAMNYETDFLKLLATADRYEIKGDKMTIFAGPQPLLVFEKND